MIVPLTFCLNSGYLLNNDYCENLQIFPMNVYTLYIRQIMWQKIVILTISDCITIDRTLFFYKLYNK